MCTRRKIKERKLDPEKHAIGSGERANDDGLLFLHRGRADSSSQCFGEVKFLGPFSIWKRGSTIQKVQPVV